jgi:hypothetical protein
MEASDGGIRGSVDSPMKLGNALAATGVEMNTPSITGRRDVFFVL